MRIRYLLVIALLLVTLFTACVRVLQYLWPFPLAGKGGGSGKAVTWTLVQEESQPIRPQSIGRLYFKPCTLRSHTLHPERNRQVQALCSTLNVAENPTEPEGRRIGLQVAWVPARNKASESDPIVLLAGGPGQSAIEAWPVLRRDLGHAADKRPVLLIDQRGSGESNRLDCSPGDASLLIDMTHAQTIELIRQCPEQLRDQADVRYYTTTEAVRDLEAVREALELPQLNLLGISYGTRVAQHYARRYPKHVRSLVLASPIPNRRANIKDASGFEHTLQELAAVCAQRPVCVQGVGDLKQTLNTLLDQVEKSPVSVTLPHPVTEQPTHYTLTRDALSKTVQMMLHTSKSAAILPTMLAHAMRGEYEGAAQMALQMDSLQTRMVSLGAYYAVTCTEDADKVEALSAPAEDPLEIAASMHALRTGCQYWPRKSLPADFREPLRGKIPTLTTSGNWDPVSSHEFGLEVIDELHNARNLLLQWEGQNTLVSGCMPRLYAQFLDTLDPIDLNAGCLHGLRPPFIPM